MILLTGSD